MYRLGISKTYVIKKEVRQKLILNDKVANYIFNRIKDDPKCHFVIYIDNNTYEEVTLDKIKQLLVEAESDPTVLEKDIFAIYDEYPEYIDVPFKVEHANPYNHRWPGDYDEEAYDDWWVTTYPLNFFLFETGKYYPVFVVHPELFDFEDRGAVVVEDSEPDNIKGYYYE